MTREHFEKILEDYEYIMGQHVVDCKPLDQGAMWRMKIRSIDEMRADNREK